MNRLVRQMKKKIIVVLVLIVILATVLAYAVINMPVSAAVFVDPEKVDTSVGQTFIVNVSVSAVSDLYGWQLRLGWNSTILNMLTASEGTFLKKGGQTLFNSIINETAGYMVLDCTLIGSIRGVNGSGILATVQFQVKTDGQCDLNLHETDLIASTEQSITHAARSGHFDSNHS